MANPDKEPTLTLVIPALNEEDAITDTLQRARSAMDALEKETSFQKCEVILVDDGSTDRTLERAKAVPGIRIVTYKPNRGYGAAIETGYAAGTGSHVAFMDADGTCDPMFLKNLWSELESTRADVVLGCRLHRTSRMPGIRRLGNSFYAWLLSAISGRRIRDAASGMRLLTRSVLPMIHPLPSGLSYTPAMSARCILDPRIQIREINMPYEERQGESKLHVVKDGLRFLRIILTTGVFYSPLRVFGSLSLLFVVLAAALAGIETTFTWVLSFLLTGMSLTSAAAGLVFHFFSKQIIPEWPTSPLEVVIANVCKVRFLVPLALLMSGVAGTCLVNGLREGGASGGMPALALHGLFSAALLLFVAAGVFIVNETYAWASPEKSPEERLEHTEIMDTQAG